MDFPGFIGPSYQLRNFGYDKQRVVNWYAEVDEVGTGKDNKIGQFIPRPGMRKILTGYGKPRGLYQTSANKLYGVFGNDLFEFNTTSFDPSKWTSARVNGNDGSYALKIPGTEQVQFTDDGFHLYIVADGKAFYYDTGYRYFTPLTAGGYASGAASPVYLNGRAIFLLPNSQQVFWTNGGNTTGSDPGLNTYLQASTDPDLVTGLIVYNQEVWVFGRRTTEIWYDAGDGTFLNPRGNTLIYVGCEAPNTIVRVSKTLGWLGSDRRGGPMVFFANGYDTQRVSTFALEERWARIAPETLAKSTAYSMQLDGHDMYVLNIPTENTTWVYDVTTSQQMGKPMWSEWQSDPGTGVQGQFLGANHVYHNGNHIFTHFANGDIFAFDHNYYKDDARYIMRERVTPFITNEMKRVFFKSLTLNFTTGER
jgi:hypothetical protein